MRVMLIALAVVMASACHARPRVWPTPQEIERQPATVRPTKRCVSLPFDGYITTPRYACYEIVYSGPRP